MKLNDAIIYRGKDRTVILTREVFENEEEFEKWLHWMRENATSKGLGRSVRLWEDMSLGSGKNTLIDNLVKGEVIEHKSNPSAKRYVEA